MAERGLTEAEWTCIKEILRQELRIWKWDQPKLRRFIEGVYFVLRTGVAWADMPERHGSVRAVERRFRRWTARGAWLRIFRAVTPDGRPGTLLVDSTACQAHRCAMGDPSAAIGKTRGGNTSKIHAAVDDDGTVRSLALTAGNVADCTMMGETLGGLRPRSVVADKGYDSARCRAEVRAAGAVPVIPARQNSKVKRPVQRRTYARRHKVENFVARIKDFARVRMRRDRTDDSYWGFVVLAAAILNMRIGWTVVLPWNGG